MISGKIESNKLDIQGIDIGVVDNASSIADNMASLATVVARFSDIKPLID